MVTEGIFKRKLKMTNNMDFEIVVGVVVLVIGVVVHVWCNDTCQSENWTKED